MAGEDKPGGFKVTDRRSFTSQAPESPAVPAPSAPVSPATAAPGGPAAASAPGAKAAASAPGAPVAPAAARSPVAPATAGAPVAPATAGAVPEAAVHGAPDLPSAPREVAGGPLPPMDFPTFILSMGSSALVLLGEIEGPDGQEPEIDLPMAKQTIDVIAMLRDKTRGNLSPPEDQLVEGLLYDLRIRFVEASKKK